MVFGGKFRIRRSNSKASYLPRQSHEKLTSDPDHGSYKLTLNSNEDCIHLPHYNGQLHSTKINNLPDVLPLGVKIKGVSATRYSSNTTLTNGNGLNQESVEKLHHHNHHHSNGGINYQQSNGKTNQMINSTKYISQSTMDLKRVHLFNNNVNTRITNTESMGNLLDCTNHRQSSPPNLQHQMLTNNIAGTDHTTATLTVAQHNAMNTNGLVQAPFQNITSDKNKLMRCNNIMDSLLTSSREQDAKVNRIQTKFMSTSTQRIHHANISEINGDDALSTDDSSNVSQLSSESISSIESNSCKTPNDSLINGIDTLTNDIDAINQNDMSFGDVDYECPSPPKSMPLTAAFPSSECENGAVNGSITKLNEMATTSEAGSQTDESILYGINGFAAAAGAATTAEEKTNMGHDSTPIKPTKTVIITRTRFADEFDCKKLTDSLVEQLSTNDRLRNILAPKVYKSSSDYVTGLYNPKMASRCVKKDAGTSMHREQRLDLTENTPLVGYAPYGNRQVNGSRFNREMQLINGDVCDLTKQKEELVIRLTKQLVALTNDRTTIIDQNTTNDLLGTDISSIVAQTVRPSEASKFRSHVDDVGHITMLLLLLSGRLARIENSLFNTNDVAEKKILEAKRTRLLEQLDEAKRLKIDIDRRGRIIAHILEKNLTTEQYADYDYFINSKAKLIVDLQEVTDRIQISEEQLNALKETLVHSEC